MESTNPFAPPTAHVTDIAHCSQTHQSVRLLSIKGRIGRLRFLTYATLNWLVLATVSTWPPHSYYLWAAVIIVAALVVFSTMLVIQRSHDMGLPGWMSFVAFIPIISLVWLCKRGNRGSNRFGLPPEPNSMGVKLIAAIELICFLALIAAIAIPAIHQR